MNFLVWINWCIFAPKITMNIIKLHPVVVVIAMLIAYGCTQSKPAENKTIPSVVVGLEIGNRAPDLAGPSPDGKTINLSSLRGKLVLIDFWASWCMPCRMENPNLVQTYNVYKDKKFKGGDGFAIYSVSLDLSKDAWISAIKNDGLAWDTHISDLQGWKSLPASTYQIMSIPSNLLIDGNGIILAKNLRAEALSHAIDALVE